MEKNERQKRKRRKRKRRKRKISLTMLMITFISISILLLVKGIVESREANDIGDKIAKEDVSAYALPIESRKETIDEWSLVLVNKDNKLPDDFSIDLAAIDDHRDFDKRAIGELKKMIDALKKAGNTNVWVQSAYRSIEKQTTLFNNKVNEYLKNGKTKTEAEELTKKTINMPGTSEHNLGLAVDFDYVDYKFDQTSAFGWLKEHAEEYGFVLRYKKEKESITGVSYEPWHWRYVGKEHAKEMNRLGLCLEEYTQYLKGEKNDSDRRG